MNLSIKNVPEDLVERLRTRARQRHRSLQGELMAILEEALEAPSNSIVEDFGPRGVREESVSRWRGFFGPGPSTDEIMALMRGED